MTAVPDNAITLHATAVAYDNHAVLIRGVSGAGKSALALDLLALGATLVSDDRTRLWVSEGTVFADAPDTIKGQIEARGVGILQVPSAGPTAVKMIVDLDREVLDRLPPLENEKILDISLPVIRKVNAPHFHAAVFAYLKHGRIA